MSTYPKVIKVELTDRERRQHYKELCARMRKFPKRIDRLTLKAAYNNMTAEKERLALLALGIIKAEE